MIPHVIAVDQISATHAKIVLAPFERGFGHTLGNALRRILLSSMPGAAPVEVIIDGVLHEYAVIEGVREDVIEILLNIKGLVFKLHNLYEVVVELEKTTEGPVLASDIKLPHDVEILNPDHLIANLSKGAKLKMQIKIMMGRGYQPAAVFLAGRVIVLLVVYYWMHLFLQ